MHVKLKRFIFNDIFFYKNIFKIICFDKIFHMRYFLEAWSGGFVILRHRKASIFVENYYYYKSFKQTGKIVYYGTE